MRGVAAGTIRRELMGLRCNCGFGVWHTYGNWRFGPVELMHWYGNCVLEMWWKK